MLVFFQGGSNGDREKLDFWHIPRIGLIAFAGVSNVGQGFWPKQLQRWN